MKVWNLVISCAFGICFGVGLRFFQYMLVTTPILNEIVERQLSTEEDVKYLKRAIPQKQR